MYVIYWEDQMIIEQYAFIASGTSKHIFDTWWLEGLENHKMKHFTTDQGPRPC